MATETELKVRLTLESFRSVRGRLEQLGSLLKTESQTELNVLLITPTTGCERQVARCVCAPMPAEASSLSRVGSKKTLF